MSLTRRQALASAAAVIASSIAKPAIAAKEPIMIGYLPALTGPSSSTGIGINRGIQLAVQEINAAGGIDGRQIELIVRDTQSDPTKAVNGAAELTHPGGDHFARVRQLPCVGGQLGQGGFELLHLGHGDRPRLVLEALDAFHRPLFRGRYKFQFRTGHLSVPL